MKVAEKESGTAPKPKLAYVPQLCEHCDDAPCMKAATNGAIYKRSDGLVIIDPVLSVGQSQLVAACPYGAIYWNSALNIPQKCTGCAHILDNSQLAGGTQTPRCVNACPTGCLQFGDDSDPAIQALMSQGVNLHPEYETKPRVYYLNLPTQFIAGALADPVADECIEGAAVTATDLTTGKVYSTTSDNYGDFWFTGLLGERSYELSITTSGYMPKKMMVYLGATDSKNVGDIELLAESS
jgi:Fe-S-cluster-containing dehydrogenase component